ncbi:MAG: hypothetical protein ACRYFS_02360 [Janthinobacterium lividum]
MPLPTILAHVKVMSMNKLLIHKSLPYVIVAVSLLTCSGCAHKDAAVTAEDKAAFAPGMANLSPEAKAAREKNESQAHQLQQGKPK